MNDEGVLEEPLALPGYAKNSRQMHNIQTGRHCGSHAVKIPNINSSSTTRQNAGSNYIGM